jgi:hypothetical protein
MQNADLTTAQDPGAVTELLSGDYFEPFGRSTSHQLWSSAMVITPVLRGLFGIEVNGLNHTVAVAPHLPAEWPEAAIKHLHVGDSTVDVTFKREGTSLVVSLRQLSGPKVSLGTGNEILRLPLPAVEVGVTHGLPTRGSRTSQLKVLTEKFEARSLRLELEGVAGTDTMLNIRRNDPDARITAEGGEVTGEQLRVHFNAGTGYVTQVVTVRW